MDPERWRRVQALFEAAADLEPRQRQELFDRECAGDGELRRQVESLIEHDGTSASFIAEPVRQAAELPSVAARLSLAGKQIGRFRVVRKLGEGGMGQVYEAEQERPVRRKVALKLVKPGLATRDVVGRFESERQALALMDHPSIARVFDAGIAPDGRPYFAMEFVEGETIVDYCDMRRLGTRERLKLFIDVCHGVQHAHHKGVIHRDIKPSNVLVQEIDGRPLPKIIDFGVAKAMGEPLSDRELKTEIGVFIGTPEYMSPEQTALGSLDLDTRSDVYSLGVLLYELLVGARPFDARGLRQAGFDEIRRRIREDVPSKPSTKLGSSGEVSGESARRRQTDVSTLIRQLRGDLDWITMKALEKERDRRYDSPAELAADIGRHLRDEPVLAGPPGVAYRARKFVRRHKVGVAAAVVVAAALIVGALGAAVGFVRAVRAEAEARREADSFKQISEFMVRLFEVSDPSEALGNEIKAREILDRGAARIASDLRDRRDVQSMMMDTMGRVYRSLGLYDSAAPLIEQSLKNRRELYGADHPQVAQGLASLGVLRHATGDFAGAEELLTQALEVLERAGAEHEEQLADTLDDLAEARRMLGDYDAAEPAGRRALEIRRRIFGNEHPKVAASLTRMAVLQRDMGDVDGAETLARDALALRERLFGELHPDVSSSVQELAFILQEQGEHDAAEELFRRGLDLDRRLVGEDHPAVATSLFNLAALLHNRGRSAEAEGLFRQVLEMDRRQLGDEHLYVSLSMGNLAGALRSQGKLDEAEATYREVLAMQRKVVGPEHPEIATTLANLGGLLRERNKLAEAEANFRETLQMRRNLLGDDHPHVAVSLTHLAGALQARGELQQAERLYREALDLRLRTVGPTHHRTGTTMIGLASLLRESERLDEAADLYTEALAIQRAQLGHDHPDVSHALVGLGQVLAEHGEPAQAESRLREAIEIRSAALGAEHWLTAEAESLLGEVLVARGRAVEARPLLVHGERILKEKFGAADPRAVRAADRLTRLPR